MNQYSRTSLHLQSFEVTESLEDRVEKAKVFLPQNLGKKQEAHQKQRLLIPTKVCLNLSYYQPGLHFCADWADFVSPVAHFYQSGLTAGSLAEVFSTDE